jgi:hypothetical protein
MAGVVYPCGLLATRQGVHSLMHSKMGALTMGMLDYSSSLSLLIELLCATPMFYCLVVVASPSEFFGSSLISAALELVSATIAARAQKSGVIQNGLAKFASLRVQDAGQGVEHSQVVPSGAGLAALDGAGATRADDATAPRPEDLLASVMVHRSLGEMTALFCGSGLALLKSHDSASSLAAKASVLLALECMTDRLKVRILSASGVPVQIVSFHLHWPVLAAVAGTGAASLLCLMTAVRLDCSFGQAHQLGFG